MQHASDAPYVLELGAVFTLLFVTLGPLKVLGPFAQYTREADDAKVKQIAMRAFVIALIAVVAGGLLGRALARGWDVSVPTLELAGGIIFFLVGLGLVLEQYKPAPSAPPALPAAPMAAAMRIAFPSVVTSYGIAALIVLLSNSRGPERALAILGVVMVIMVLNLLAMLYARQIMGGVVVVGMQILGAVLGVLQVGLALEMILRGLRDLGVLRG